MEERYSDKVKIFKALADTKRMMVVDMLSCGELCACEILEKFNITQPTLSHHMKILENCGLVTSRKEGKWTYYTLKEDMVSEFSDFVVWLTSDKEDCICKKEGCNCGKK